MLYLKFVLSRKHNISNNNDRSWFNQFVKAMDFKIIHLNDHLFTSCQFDIKGVVHIRQLCIASWTSVIVSLGAP